MAKEEIIASILQEYLPVEKIEELLNAGIDEYSLRQSLNVIKSTKKESTNGPWWLKLALFSLIVVHGILVFGIIFSFFALPFAAPWYIALPLCTFIWFFATSRIDCKLTNAENYLRVRLGKKRIGGFVGHYFMKPIKNML